MATSSAFIASGQRAVHAASPRSSMLFTSFFAALLLLLLVNSELRRSNIKGGIVQRQCRRHGRTGRRVPRRAPRRASEQVSERLLPASAARRRRRCPRAVPAARSGCLMLGRRPPSCARRLPTTPSPTPTLHVYSSARHGGETSSSTSSRMGISPISSFSRVLVGPAQEVSRNVIVWRLFISSGREKSLGS